MSASDEDEEEQEAVDDPLLSKSEASPQTAEVKFNVTDVDGKSTVVLDVPTSPMTPLTPIPVKFRVARSESVKEGFD
jgi:hypothetical protein